MPRSYHRFIILIGALISLLLVMSLLYMLGMYFLEGQAAATSCRHCNGPPARRRPRVTAATHLGTIR